MGQPWAAQVGLLSIGAFPTCPDGQHEAPLAEATACSNPIGRSLRGQVDVADP
jgi:hypothetical protein